MMTITFRGKKRIMATVSLNKNTVVENEDGTIQIETTFKSVKDGDTCEGLYSCVTDKIVSVSFISDTSDCKMRKLLKIATQKEQCYMLGTLYALPNGKYLMRLDNIYFDASKDNPICEQKPKVAPDVPLLF